jgi:hypothetical protein
MLRLDPTVEDGDAHEVLPTTLVVRASCGARNRMAAGVRVQSSELAAGRGSTPPARMAELTGVPARPGKAQKGASR